ncbi:3-isopropylmalate dehydrogenase [Actinobaculum suis]|uniref:3-isopropylmalate dehydrogenase n=2 Tax=Actinobaculum suis TaxID=1657 RepID=A0A1G6ZQ66_9ACTO|nr:3-isopropylmalate dehydrogenase [Actinobaculum suis]
MLRVRGTDGRLWHKVRNMRTSIDLAVIHGDGIGPEIVPEGIKALRAVLAGSNISLQTTPYELGADHYRKTGQTLEPETLARLRDHDAILLGAIGDPAVPSGVLERGILLKLRFAFDHYVNLRPNRYYPGVETPLANPGNIDFLVVREGTEGLYSGNGGITHKDSPLEVATEVSVNTGQGTERLVRYAFELANQRPRKHLTWVHKENVLVHAGNLWRRKVELVAPEYPEVTTEYMHADAATIYLVSDPARFDVLATDNLFGDILTDEAGAVTGGVGLAASGNINPEGQYPSMFEPIHGSAPDIAGKQLADPTATIASVSLLLQHLGLSQYAQQVDAAIEADMAARAQAVTAGTPLRRSTAEIGDAIAERILAAA